MPTVRLMFFDFHVPLRATVVLCLIFLISFSERQVVVGGLGKISFILET